MSGKNQGDDDNHGKGGGNSGPGNGGGDNSGPGGGGHGGDDNTITLNVGTPKGSFKASFAKNAKVSDIIQAAIKTKGLDGAADSFEVFFGQTPLTPIERTLVSFGLKDGDTVLVAATGSGV